LKVFFLGYRRKLDIIADMLHVASSEGAKKTQIMYQANLSYRLLTKYLVEVRKACLVSFERSRRCYVLTSKGRQFLEVYKEYSRRTRYVEKHLNDVNGKRKVLESLCSQRSGGVE
jgi:predicted transcriptional regulator